MSIYPRPPAMVLLRVAAAIGLTLPCGVASAQTQASPETLNDCTKLADPARLQQCIIQNQGGRKLQGRFTSPPTAPDAPLYRGSESPNNTVAPLLGPP